jgi:prepilin-type N-terminal cleavage/methylation domain-containing protein
LEPKWCGPFRRVAASIAVRRQSATEATRISEDSAFTIIELMVVLLVMGILMAIAIPTFLGATGVANDQGEVKVAEAAC